MAEKRLTRRNLETEFQVEFRRNIHIDKRSHDTITSFIHNDSSFILNPSEEDDERKNKKTFKYIIHTTTLENARKIVLQANMGCFYVSFLASSCNI